MKIHESHINNEGGTKIPTQRIQLPGSPGVGRWGNDITLKTNKSTETLPLDVNEWSMWPEQGGSEGRQYSTLTQIPRRSLKVYD